jgi:hypothetical protein
MKKIKLVYNKIKYISERIYRVLNVNKSAAFVWKDLVKYHKSAGLHYRRYDKEKIIHRFFEIDDTNCIDFCYCVEAEKLNYRATILQSFDEEITNDILVLAAHFNALLTYGSVKVSVKYNYVEFLYSRDLLIYSLFPEEIDLDTHIHSILAQDCFKYFANLIETGNNPVFIFSDYLEENKAKAFN